MKKKITALLAGILAIVITAKAQAPVVTFTATSTTLCAGTSTTFTNTTNPAATVWAWYFPGGSPSSFVVGAPGNPTTPITYSFPGTYNVTCVAINSSGRDSVTKVNYIQVGAVPNVQIHPPSGGICDVDTTAVQDTVQFTLSGNNSSDTYAWQPNGGGSLSCASCPNPKASPSITTVYTLVVTNTLDGCKSTYYDTITVGGANMQAKITGKDSICQGQVDSLIASGGSSNPASKYHWSTGATTSSIGVSPNIPTTYSVTITSGSGSCMATASFFVNVFAAPNFTVTYTPADSICYPQSVTMSVSPPSGSPYVYFWYGPPNGVEDTDRFTVSPSSTTTYTLVVQDGGCVFQSLQKIKVDNNFVVTFTGASNLCQGSSTIITAAPGDQYHWSTGATTSSIDVTPPVSITYTVLVHKGACYVDTDFTVTIDTMPNVVFKGDTSICQGDSTIIYVVPGSNYTYLWNTTSTADSVATGPIYGGITYWVTVTKGACSKDSDQIRVKVYPHPKPKIYPIDTTVCEYDSVQLTATGGNYYTWTPNTNAAGLNHYLFYGDTDKNNAAPPVSLTYTVKVCTWGCCKDTTLQINIRPNVQGAKVCCNDTIKGGTPVQLSATFDTGPYSITGWSPASGLSCTTCANPVATVYNTTTYVATFSDQNGCLVKDSITIDVFNCTIFVPNIFSPGQEANNILYVRSLCMASMTFNVYDRFGNMVFTSTTIKNGWDGTYKGKPMNMGTYMWTLTGILQDGTNVSKSGNVTLLR